jgi:hypothetical protein
MGTVNEVEWKRQDSIPAAAANGPSDTFTSHVFTPTENLGFEVFGGIQFDKSKFVIGYNLNKGLSMNSSIEAPPDAQIKYRQMDTDAADGLFERGGVFVKLVISW